MKWPKRLHRRMQIEASLKSFSAKRLQLPGIATAPALETLAMQMIASLRRMDMTKLNLTRDISPKRANPASEMFDPERAAIFHIRNGDIDEAIWLLFLATHFGKNLRYGWLRLRDVYSGCGTTVWSWKRVSKDVKAFRVWLRANEGKIRGAFGNHRKYTSLSATKSVGTGAAIAAYVNWVGPSGSHATKFAGIVKSAGNDPHKIFDAFYRDMDVVGFGRLGKFDFLTLVGRLGGAPIEPGSTYLDGATGPAAGAKLLFQGNRKAKVKISELEAWLVDLDSVLKVGMQVMEDSLCNWQKSPTKFVHFRG